jgi:hypothetical protein
MWSPSISQHVTFSLSNLTWNTGLPISPANFLLTVTISSLEYFRQCPCWLGYPECSHCGLRLLFSLFHILYYNLLGHCLSSLMGAAYLVYSPLSLTTEDTCDSLDTQSSSANGATSWKCTYYRSNACVSPTFICWNPNHFVMLSEGRASGDD